MVENVSYTSYVSSTLLKWSRTSRKIHLSSTYVIIYYVIYVNVHLKAQNFICFGSFVLEIYFKSFFNVLFKNQFIGQSNKIVQSISINHLTQLLTTFYTLYSVCNPIFKFFQMRSALLSTTYQIIFPFKNATFAKPPL